MIVILVIVIILFFFLWFSARNYEKELIHSLPGKDHPLAFMYPIAFFLIDKAEQLKKKSKLFHGCRKKLFVNQEIKEKLKALYIGENLEMAVHVHRGRKLALALLVFLIFDVMAFLGCINQKEGKLIEGKYLQRPSWKTDDTFVNLTALIKDTAGGIFQKELKVTVSKEKLTADEINEEFDKGIVFLDKNCLKNNESADSISASLYFPNSIADTGIKVAWSSSNTKVLENDGTIHNEDLKDSAVIEVTAKLTLQGRSLDYTRAYAVQPKVYTKEEKAAKELEDSLKLSDKTNREEKQLTLPEKIPGYAVSWKEKKENISVKLFVLGFAAALFSIPLTNREVSQRALKREEELLLDYPGIINKFLLLVNAGMSTSNAWIKIAEDYRKACEGKKRRYAFEEMVFTAKELKMGVSENTAYEEFGRRIKLMPYLRFSALLAQNIQKGSPDFIRILEAETLKAFEERKEAAKKAGEEAGTKLLVPMMIMLVLVMIIILVPALSAFQL